jgi:hypothetical protein
MSDFTAEIPNCSWRAFNTSSRPRTASSLPSRQRIRRLPLSGSRFFLPIYPNEPNPHFPLIEDIVTLRALSISTNWTKSLASSKHYDRGIIQP